MYVINLVFTYTTAMTTESTSLAALGTFELGTRGAGGLVLPGLVKRSPRAAEPYVEWLLATIRNKGTRTAYASALRHFDAWLSTRMQISIEQLQSVHVAAYIEHLVNEGLSASTAKLRLAAISELCKHLVVRQVMPHNPAAMVKPPRQVKRKGSTPVLSGEQARAMIEACGSDGLRALRDKALTCAMLFTFGRVSATTKLRVKDYQGRGRRAVLVLREKGGKIIEAPCHHELAEHMDAWLEASGLAAKPGHVLFPPIVKGELRDKPLDAQTTLLQLQRRARRAGVDTRVSNHALRATGITAYLRGGGKLEIAQYLAGHADPATTQLYDRRTEEVAAGEVERIRFE